MNKKLKKCIAVLSTIALSTTLFMGCGKNESKEKTEKRSEKVELALWVAENNATQKALDERIKSFQEKNSNITVKKTQYDLEDMRKNFLSAAVAGNGPELLLGPGDNIGVFVTGDTIQPIDNIVGKDFLNRFSEESVKASSYKEKQWMIPDRTSSGLFLIYNKKMVQQAPKTFEELETISKKLKDEGKVQYGLTFNEVEPYFTAPFMRCFGAKFFEDENAQKPKPTLDSDGMKEWAKFLVRIHSEGLVPKMVDLNTSDNLFQEGKAAFTMNGPWAFANYTKAGIDFGVALLPTLNGKDMAPTSSMSGFTVSASVKDADKKEAIKTFLDFISNEESQIKLSEAHGKLPTNKKCLASDKYKNDPLFSIQVEQGKKCIPMPIIPQMRGIWDAMKPVQQELFGGKMTPEKAPAEMQKKAEENIKNLGF